MPRRIAFGLAFVLFSLLSIPPAIAQESDLPDRPTLRDPWSKAPAAPTEDPWDSQAKRYHGILADLAADADRAAAIGALAELETELLGDNPDGADEAMKRLRKAELKVVRKLADRDAEIFLPILLLHRDTGEAHREAERPYLVLHSIQMVHAMAMVYAKRGDNAETRALAAGVIATLAGQLQARRQLSVSNYLFEEALSLDPTNELALLGLAVTAEKSGGPFDQAIHHLEDLLKSQPGHREARLRLALALPRAQAGADLAQSGAIKRCRALLTELVAEPDEDWILSLAAQELARVHADASRLAEAIAVLEDARARRPDQKLDIQLAYLRDRDRNSSGAQHLAEALSRDARGASTPLPDSEVPRRRYNQWPFETLRAERRQLDRAGELRRARLAKATSIGEAP